MRQSVSKRQPVQDGALNKAKDLASFKDEFSLLNHVANNHDEFLLTEINTKRKQSKG